MAHTNRKSNIPVGALMLCIALSVAAADNPAAAAGSPMKLRELSADEVAKIQEAAPAQASARPAKPRKVLVFWLCKGFFHECIPVANKAIEVLGEKTGAYQTVTSNDMAVFDANNLQQYDAVVFNNTTQLDFPDPAQRKALLDFVNSGKGIIGLHAATDNFYKWPEAAEMMGGLFSAHPWTSNGTWAIKNADPQHPVNAAFKGEGFKVKDEIYRIKPLNLEKNCRVLLRLDLSDDATRSAQGVQESDIDMPVSWIRNYGGGRVFYCGLGHNNEIYRHRAILQHCLDGIQFALGDYPVDASPKQP